MAIRDKLAQSLKNTARPSSSSNTPFSTYDYRMLNLQLEKRQMTRDEAWNLANHWVAAWNGHDLDLIMMHYEDAIELTSPVAAQLLGTSDGKIVGKANLKLTFSEG
jgi:hypothetical protein